MSSRCLWVILAVLFATNAQAAPNLRDGMWEITARLEMPGMSANLPPVKHTQCLTSKDAVPHKPEKDQDCTTSSLKQERDGISWTIQCRSSEGTVDSSGKATYRGEGMDGAMSMNVRDGRGKDVMKMTYRITGKRAGDCAP